MNKGLKDKKMMIDDAIDKGVNYLMSLTDKGRWRGFPTMAGESDIWVTGFVLAHIKGLSFQANEIKESLEFLLNFQQPSGGWSYHSMVPADADSTAWCLIALNTYEGITEEVAEKGKSFLWSNYVEPGVSTFGSELGIRKFIEATINKSMSGWTNPHPSVSLAAVLADQSNEKVPGIIKWLLNQQTEEGMINSYWWRGPYYTTTLLLRAMSQIDQRLEKEHAQKIVQGLVDKQISGGGFGLDSSSSVDAFSTALALESFVHLSYLDNHRERSLCGKALLQAQADDGGWKGGLIMRIPAPDIVNPIDVISWNAPSGGGNSLIPDKDGIFATAMACHALACWREMELPEIIISNNHNDPENKTR